MEDGGAVKAVVFNGKRSTRSSASSLGSPHNGRDLKSKGRTLPVEEELDEIDADADADPDADADGDYDEDEGMDIDAEGEDDDDIVMGNA